MPSKGLMIAAWDELSTHRGRSALSMLSVVIGIAALTLVVAAGEIGRQSVLAQVERTAGRPVTLDLTLQPGNAAGGVGLRDFVEERLSRYGIAQVSAFDRYDVTAQLGTLTSRLELFGVSASLADVRRLDIVSGRWLTLADEERLGPVIVCNAACARELGVAPADTAATVSIDSPVGSFQAVVVGIVDDGLETGAAYGAASPLRRWVGPQGPAINYLIHVSPRAPIEPFRQRVGVDVEQFDERIGFQLDRIDRAEEFTAAIGTLQLVLGVIAGLALITGGIGMLNIGLLTTQQRIREFGMRRAFGAAARDIFLLVLAESLFVTVVAGLLGVSVALGLSVLLPVVLAVDGAEAIVPVGPAIAGLVVAALIGVVAGAIPAWRASRTSIIRAIRD